MNLLPKILMQVANALMVLIVLYVSDTFFRDRDIHYAYLVFSGVVYVGSVLSLLGLLAQRFSVANVGTTSFHTTPH